MTKLLEQAIAEAAGLPDAAQDKIGRELLAHVDRLRRLRADIDSGLCSLDAGKGKPVDIEAVIRRARRGHDPD